jgi:hypothetical protein
MRKPVVEGDRFVEALKELEVRHAVRARKARSELATLLRFHADAPEGERQAVSLRLEKWLVRAAKLLSEIRGPSYQARMRAWIMAGILAESKSLER